MIEQYMCKVTRTRVERVEKSVHGYTVSADKKEEKEYIYIYKVASGRIEFGMVKLGKSSAAKTLSSTRTYVTELTSISVSIKVEKNE